MAILTISGANWIAFAHQQNRITPFITETPLPPVNPTPFGRPILIGTPLPTPEPADKIIDSKNVSQLVDILQLGELSNKGVSDAIYTRDGRRLVEARGNIIVWEMPIGEKIRTIPISNSSHISMAISPDGQIVAIGDHGNPGWVELWDIGTGELVRQHQGGERVSALSFNSSGTLLAAGRENGGVTVWEVDSGHLLNQIFVNSYCSGMVFHPLLDEIAVSSNGNSIQIFNAWSGLKVRVLTIPFSSPSYQCTLSHLAYRPDGGMLAAAMFYDKSIALWEGDIFVGLLKHDGGGEIGNIVWSPDGKMLVASEKGIVLWEVKSQTIIANLGELGELFALSPDGAMMVIDRLNLDDGQSRLHLLKAPYLIYLPRITFQHQ